MSNLRIQTYNRYIYSVNKYWLTIYTYQGLLDYLIDSQLQRRFFFYLIKIFTIRSIFRVFCDLLSSTIVRFSLFYIVNLPSPQEETLFPINRIIFSISKQKQKAKRSKRQKKENLCLSFLYFQFQSLLQPSLHIQASGRGNLSSLYLVACLFIQSSIYCKLTPSLCLQLFHSNYSC